MHSYDNTKPAILCMFSGGIDSTGVLHKLVTEKQYRDLQLLIHHIHIGNREKRDKAENNAVMNILNFYRKNFEVPFLFTQSVFDTSGFAPLRSNRFPLDVDVCSFVAANVCIAHGNIHKITRGRTKTDIDGNEESDEMRMAKTYGILETTLGLAGMKYPEYLFPVLTYTKAEIWNFLPAEVRTKTWWCRNPVYRLDGTAQTCNRCSTCVAVNKFL